MHPFHHEGTLSDKVAALTLLVQEAPLFRLKTLDTLINLASKSDRRCAQMALEAIKVSNPAVILNLFMMMMMMI